MTPWLSDRDLALQNVRYVLNAAGNLHEDFHPAPGRFIAERARQVLAETIDTLLDDRCTTPTSQGDLAAGCDRRRHVPRPR